jgi:exonuclease SbcC
MGTHEMKKLTLKNFQKHRLLKIDLDPVITTILGPTDRGKSSIIRALQFLALNNPPSNLITEGQKNVEVVLDVDDHSITRKKGTENLYEMDGEEYKAFGTGVPDDIQTALALSPLNFQKQHDSPFWFAETAGEVSRQLNKIVDLEIIDTTLSNLSSSLRKARGEKDVTAQRLEEAKEERSRLKFVRQMRKDFDELEEIAKAQEKSADKCSLLQNLLAEVSTHWADAERLREATTEAERVVDLGARWERTNKSVNLLESLVESVKSDYQIASIQIPSLEGMDQRVGAINALRRKKLDLSNLLEDVQQDQERSDSLKSRLEKASTELHEKMGEECPLCGQKIKS